MLCWVCRSVAWDGTAANGVNLTPEYTSTPAPSAGAGVEVFTSRDQSVLVPLSFLASLSDEEPTSPGADGAAEPVLPSSESWFSR